MKERNSMKGCGMNSKEAYVITVRAIEDLDREHKEIEKKYMSDVYGQIRAHCHRGHYSGTVELPKDLTGYQFNVIYGILHDHGYNIQRCMTLARKLEVVWGHWDEAKKRVIPIQSTEEWLAEYRAGFQRGH